MSLSPLFLILSGPNYMILIGRGNLIDNITKTVPGKPDCAIMAFTWNLKIMGSLFFVRKILWCFPDMSLPVYIPTGCLQGPMTFQNWNKCIHKNKHNRRNMNHCILMHYATIYRVCLLGKFDFEQITKSVLPLLSTARTKTRIGISLQHQGAYIVEVQRLHSS